MSFSSALSRNDQGLLTRSDPPAARQLERRCRAATSEETSWSAQVIEKPPQPPFPRPSPQGTPDGPTLAHPALPVQAAQHRAPPCSGARRRGCRAALGAPEYPRRGVPLAGGGGGSGGVRSRGAGAKMPFVFPIRYHMLIPLEASFFRTFRGLFNVWLKNLRLCSTVVRKAVAGGDSNEPAASALHFSPALRRTPRSISNFA